MNRAPRWRGGLRLATGVLLVAAAGCGGGHAAASTTPRDCGSIRTAGGGTTDLKITKGTATCTTARHVFTDYFADIKSGKAPSQTGEGALRVDGWECVINTSADIQRTGIGGACTDGPDTVTAVHPTT